MKKIIFLCFIFVNLLYGFNYNDLLLKAQASIFPKIMLLDKKLEEKLVEGKIIYTIIYDENDFNIAVEVSKFIDMKNRGYFDKYTYEINLVTFSDFSNKTDATALYILNSDSDIKKVANIAKEKGIVAFSYDIKYLKQGLLFSLIIEKSTILYLNKENLYTQKIEFVDSLLQMVRFVDKNNG